VFVTKVKTRLFTSANLTRVSACMDSLGDLPLSPVQSRVLSSPYCVNMADRNTWRLRSFLGLCLERIKEFGLEVEKDLARSILLGTAQWALDCRKETPTIPQFREQLKIRAREAVRGAELFRQGVLTANRERRPRSLCLLRSAIGSEHDVRLKRFG